MAKKAKSSGLSIPQQTDSRAANQNAAYEANAAAAYSVDKGQPPLTSAGGLVASGGYTRKKK